MKPSDFVVADFETQAIFVKKFNKSGKEMKNYRMSRVVSAALFDGFIEKTWFLNDFIGKNGNYLDLKCGDELLLNFLNFLLNNYSGRDIYFHNFSGFDSMFLIKILASAN